MGVSTPFAMTDSHLIDWTLEFQFSRKVQSTFAKGREGTFLVISDLASVRMQRSPESVQD